jgi:hypothetical protein
MATIPVLPFAVAIGLVQTLHIERLTSVLLALALAAAVCAAILAAPAGRRSMEPLLPDRWRRRGSPEDDPCD